MCFLRESLGTFVTRPFTELWKSSEKLKQHFGKDKEMGKETHKTCCSPFQNDGKAEPISGQLDRELSERVMENRSKLSSIVKIFVDSKIYRCVGTVMILNTSLMVTII